MVKWSEIRKGARHTSVTTLGDAFGVGDDIDFLLEIGFLFAFCCSSSSSTPSAHFPPHKRFKNVDRISMHTPPTLAKWKTAITDNFCQGSAQSESLISGYDYDAKWCNFSWLYVPDFIPLLESPQSIDFNSLGIRERGALFPFLLLFFGGIVRDEWRQHSTRSCSESYCSEFARHNILERLLVLIPQPIN